MRHSVIVSFAIAILSLNCPAVMAQSRPSGSMMPGAVEIRPLPALDEAYSEQASDGRPDHLRRQMVTYSGVEIPGTLIVDTAHTHLFLVLEGGRALRYGIGVGREGFTWAGRERVSRMAEWPDWHPPKEMIARQPYLPRVMAGGPGNPLGARAIYLGDTLYRIHGTNQPETIGKYVSSGCIRLVNDDIVDLYGRVRVGASVVVLGTDGATPDMTVRHVEMVSSMKAVPLPRSRPKANSSLRAPSNGKRSSPDARQPLR